MLVGLTFVKRTLVWGAIGQRLTLTVFLTAVEASGVQVTWQQEVSEDSAVWADVPSNVPSIISDVDDKNVMSTILVMNKLKESDIRCSL